MTLTLQNDVDISVKVGKVPSLNSFYAGKHFTYRSAAKKKFKAEILEQLEQYDPVQFESVQVRAEVNYRYDIDNCIMAVKFAMDAFKDWGGVIDDTKKYFPKMVIIYNPDIELNTSKIFFIGTIAAK